MNKIFVVILNYKGQADTLDCLRSIMDVKKADYELHTIVVDNFPDKPIELDTKDYKEIKLEVIYNKSNLGFSGGMNVGINQALKGGADYIVILNNDTLVDKNFLNPLYDSLRNDNSLAIAIPKIYYAKGYEFHKGKYKENELGKIIWYGGGHMDWDNINGIHEKVDEFDTGNLEETKTTELATGCCMMVNADVFKKIGILNDKYFLYYEDADFNERAKRAGYKILFVPQSVIWHKNAQSSGGSGSALQDYYVTRNRLSFGLKYAPTRTKAHLVKESLTLLLKGRPWQKIAIKDFYFGRMGKGSFII